MSTLEQSILELNQSSMPSVVRYGTYLYKENLLTILLDQIDDLEAYSKTHENIYKKRILVIRDLIESMKD